MSEVTIKLESLGRGMHLLRIGGVDAITPLVMLEVAELCLEKCETCADKDKLIWYEMFCKSAKDIVNHDACPEEGVKVFGQFMLDSVRIPEPGDKVVVAKGAYLRSFYPNDESDRAHTKRRQTVTVDHIIGGYVDFDRGLYVKNPEVVWAGKGGYWKWVSPEHIEVNQQTG